MSTNYTSYGKGTNNAVLGDQFPVPPMYAAIESGFYSTSSNQEGDSVALLAGCNTGFCNFGKYQSLAVCNLCIDVSDNITNPQGCANGQCPRKSFYSLPADVGLTLDANNGVINLTSDTLHPTEPAMAGIGPLIARFHALAANNFSNPGSGAFATECAAYWYVTPIKNELKILSTNTIIRCVQTYIGSVENSTLQETIITNWTNTSAEARTSYKQSESIILTPDDCFQNDSVPTNSSYCTHRVGNKP